tara:strand:+ start:408 stop:1385 length:978 start_codon:yes stop_codon:yes gene_type:complete
VVCGSLLITYEHIDPEFHDAKSHDPSKMTVLCMNCQRRKGAALSADYLFERKKKPFCIERGYSSEELYGLRDDFKVYVGGNLITNTVEALRVDGIPRLWFNSDSAGRPLLNFVFSSHDKKIILLIKDNEVRASTDNIDFNYFSTRRGEMYEIYNETGIVLKFRISADEGVVVERAEIPDCCRGALSIGESSVSILDSNGSTVGKISGSSITRAGVGINIGKWPVHYFGDAARLAKTDESKLVSLVQSRGWDGIFHFQGIPLFAIKGGCAFDPLGSCWGRVSQGMDGVEVVLTEAQYERLPNPLRLDLYAKNGESYTLNLYSLLSS